MELNPLTDEIVRLRLKLKNSLANNLCHDHRDKQSGKPCLACEIDRLRTLNAKLVEACELADRTLRYAATDAVTSEVHYAEIQATTAFRLAEQLSAAIKEAKETMS